MTVTPFTDICFFDRPVRATSYTELWRISGKSLFQSSPSHTIAAYRDLSLDDVPQSFVQFGKIGTMVYAGQDDGA
jgi:hypothetical protein